MTRLFYVTHWDSWFVSPLGMSQPQEQKPQAVTRLCSLHSVRLATPDLTLAGSWEGSPEVTSSGESQMLSSGREPKG